MVMHLSYQAWTYLGCISICRSNNVPREGQVSPNTQARILDELSSDRQGGIEHTSKVRCSMLQHIQPKS